MMKTALVFALSFVLLACTQVSEEPTPEEMTPPVEEVEVMEEAPAVEVEMMEETAEPAMEAEAEVMEEVPAE